MKHFINTRYSNGYLQAKYTMLAFAPTFEEVTCHNRVNDDTEGEDEGQKPRTREVYLLKSLCLEEEESLSLFFFLQGVRASRVVLTPI